MKHLSPTGMKQAEFARNVWSCIAQHGITVEDAQRPEFWAHHAKELKQWDKIELRAEDGSFFAELLITQVAETFARVQLLNLYKFSNPVKAPMLDLDVAWGGPNHKWRVMRKDKTVLKAHFDSEEAAESWKADFLKAA